MKYMNTKPGIKVEPQLCVVCGARVRWYNSGSNNTCDSTCLRAKRSGLTREARMRQDIIHANARARFEDLHAQQRIASYEHALADCGNYNRPYLSVYYA
jgi:hypothetical protein